MTSNMHLAALPLYLKIVLGLTLMVPFPILLATLEARHKERPFSSRLFHFLVLPIFVHVAAACYAYARLLRDMAITGHEGPIVVATGVAEAQATLPVAAFLVITVAAFALVALRNEEWGEATMRTTLIAAIAVFAAELILGWRLAAGLKTIWICWTVMGIALACALAVLVIAIARSKPVARSAVSGAIVVAVIIVLAVWQVTRVLISVALRCAPRNHTKMAQVIDGVFAAVTK